MFCPWLRPHRRVDSQRPGRFLLQLPDGRDRLFQLAEDADFRGAYGRAAARTLDGMAITIDGAPVVSIPIAVCLFLMMYPIMVKIDFAEVVRAGKAVKPVGLTLFINWAVKPFTMYAIASFFLDPALCLQGSQCANRLFLTKGRVPATSY